MNALDPTRPRTEVRLAELRATLAATRETIQRIATHVLARRRHAVSGKFGLRATPGGIGTPAFGPEHEVVRITGTTLVQERTGETARSASLDLRTATLADAAPSPVSTCQLPSKWARTRHR